MGDTEGLGSIDAKIWAGVVMVLTALIMGLVMKHAEHKKQGNRNIDFWQQVFNGAGMLAVIGQSMLASDIISQNHKFNSNIETGIEHGGFMLLSIFTMIWFISWAFKDQYLKANGDLTL